MLVQELHRASPGDVVGFVRAAPLALHVLRGDFPGEIWKLHVIGVEYLMTIALGRRNEKRYRSVFLRLASYVSQALTGHQVQPCYRWAVLGDLWRQPFQSHN